jgi:hypothetical protein
MHSIFSTIVCAGGSDEDSKTAQHVWCYSDKKNKWFSLTSMPYDPGVEFATCAYGNAIYISGGSAKMNSMLCYISRQNKWVHCDRMLLGRRRRKTTCFSCHCSTKHVVLSLNPRHFHQHKQ